MITTIGSRKGGVGKSTTTVNLAAELARQGKDVVIVDADTQQTSSNWVDDRNNTNLPRVHCVQKYGNIKSTLLDLNERYEYVLCDPAGRDSKELRSALLASHVILVPFRPSQPDLDTLPHMSDMISDALDYNPGLKALGLITMAPTNVFITETREAKELLAELDTEIRLLNDLIYDRKVYRDAISKGLGVTETSKPKAKAEIQILLQDILKCEA